MNLACLHAACRRHQLNARDYAQSKEDYVAKIFEFGVLVLRIEFASLRPIRLPAHS
jgi:hypothetical protein